MSHSASWKKIFNDYNILSHDFAFSPFEITARQIKISCQDFKETGEKEVRILCKQDTKSSRPDIFKENDLFILPVKNGTYNIIKGEGYIDIPSIVSSEINYQKKLDFELETSEIGNSEMQHLDYAYAVSLVRTFVQDPSLVLTIRGRKYTPDFSFFVNEQKINVSGVQTEVDAGYEGRNKIVLVEAKSAHINNIVIRQLYYPFLQWKTKSSKDVVTVFFEKDIKNNTYSFWEFIFTNQNDYNSIKLVKSAKYKING